MTMAETHDDEWQGSWYSAWATCDVCLHQWAAVYPSCCQLLECPNCGHMTRATHLVEQEDREAREREQADEPDEPWRS
jgi:hypothetical protein